MCFLAQILRFAGYYIQYCDAFGVKYILQPNFMPDANVTMDETKQTTSMEREENFEI